LERSSQLFSQAYETWVAVVLLYLNLTLQPKRSIYGLPPHQQAAEIYEGPGYEGHGGWSWYTGAAARMLSARCTRYLGLEVINGELQPAPADTFDPKGRLKLESVDFKGKRFSA